MIRHAVGPRTAGNGPGRRRRSTAEQRHTAVLAFRLKAGVPHFLSTHGYRVRRGDAYIVVSRRGKSHPVLLLRPIGEDRLEVRVHSNSRYGSTRLRSEAATLDALSEPAQAWRLLGLLNLMTSEMVGTPRAARADYERLSVRGICSGGLPSLGKRR